MNKPRIKLRVVDRLGKGGCRHGHRIGDTFDYDTDRGKLCPLALHVAFPYIDILRYGGTPPRGKNGEIRFCCPDVDVINVFRLEVEEAPKESSIGREDV